MPDQTRPFLVPYVIWHPKFAAGKELANALLEHFRRKLYENVAGGTGLSVMFRSEPAQGANVPLAINLDEAYAAAIVVFVDSSLAGDPDWVKYVQGLSAQTQAAGLKALLFPVAIDEKGLSIGLDEQALHWNQWTGTEDELRQRLISKLTYEFCRMLRHYLEHIKRPDEEVDELERFLHRVQIFLSHSKHDDDGERIAKLIRDHLNADGNLQTFFDVLDIPAGLRFQQVLLKQVRQSAVVAIHTDSYSSREWCRREIIEAKRWNVPLVVANCITNQDERAFPYLGNVPIVRMDPQPANRIDAIIARLLDEVLKDFLWRCRVQLVSTGDPAVVFVPRQPELVSLAALPSQTEAPKPTIVYPDPPLSGEELLLFADLAPQVQLRSMTEWLAGVDK
jgi:hypothetical protein